MVGCYNLGVMVENGDSVAKDAAQAVSLFRKACDGGEMRGCDKLGLLYEAARESGKTWRRQLPCIAAPATAER